MTSFQSLQYKFWVIEILIYISDYNLTWWKEAALFQPTHKSFERCEETELFTTTKLTNTFPFFIHPAIFQRPWVEFNK